MSTFNVSISRIVFISGMLAVLLTLVIQSRVSDAYDPAGSVFPTHAVTLGHMWRLEIANTDALRTLGLGERDSLPRDTGMLFLFNKPDRYGFWMEGMRFSLDMVFLLRGEIIFIERGIQPGDQRIIVPSQPFDQVIELNSGEANGLESGGKMWYVQGYQN